MTPPPLIELPEKVSRRRRTVLGAVTAIIWIFYAYLWVPLITLIAWFIGGHTAWQRLYVEDNAVDPFMLAALPIIALLCGLLLIGWAEYNRQRFSGADKRQRSQDVQDLQVAQTLGAPPALARTLREHRIVRVSLDDDARLLGTTVVAD